MPTTCRVWFLGEYDGVYYHYAEYYPDKNDCNVYEPTWWLDSEELKTCPEVCPNCLSQGFAKLSCPPTRVGTPFPADGKHTLPAHVIYEDHSVRFKVKLASGMVGFKLHHYVVDAAKGVGNKIPRTMMFAISDGGDVGNGVDEATLTTPKAPKPCATNFYLVKLKGNPTPIPIVVKPGAKQ